MIRKFILPLVIVGASVFGFVGLMATSPIVEPSVPQPLATTVRVQSVNPMPVQLRVNAQGSVEPSTESDLIPEVSGRVTWVSRALVNGGFFEQDDLLLRLEDKDYQSSVDRAQATLTRTSAEYEHARFEYQRFKSLQERKLASISQTENALRAMKVAKSALKEAEVNHRQSERDLARTQIRAPFTGLVRSENVDIGQFASRGTPIATVYATDQVEVRLPIADRQLAFLQLPIGNRGELTLEQQPNVTLSADYAGRKLTWQGKIVRTEAQIDTASRMVHVIARVNNNEQETPLSVGLFVSAQIEGLLAKDIVVLPRIALRNNNQVLVVDDNNALRFREIDPLRLYKDNVYIRGGLSSGERVCVSPIQTAIEGMSVNPVSDS